MKAYALILMLLCLGGCITTPTTAPTHEDIQQADFGYPDSSEATRKERQAYLDDYEDMTRRSLFDPWSAQIKWDAPRRAVLATKGKDEPKYIYGTLNIMRVNAKNRYGAYTGWHTTPLFCDAQGTLVSNQLDYAIFLVYANGSTKEISWTGLIGR